MFSASSKSLLGRGCRPRCWRSPRFAGVHAERNLLAAHHYHHNPEFGAASTRNVNFYRRCHSHLAFSTITFGGSAFPPNASSPKYAEFDGRTPPRPVTSEPTAPRLSEGSSERREFQQRILQWMATNPKIAPYKAEESLARLWVKQQELFRQWEEERRRGASASSPAVVLTTDSVNLVLHAWCYSDKGEIAAARAERLLHWMEDLHSEPLEGSDSSELASWSSFLPKPNYQSYATVIDAWARSAAYESSHSNVSHATETKSGGRAKNVVPPATKTGFECAKRAEDVLMHMQTMHEHQLGVAERRAGSDAYNSEIQPDTRVFNLVLKAWSSIKGGTKASAIRAMRILDLMQELHHSQSMDAPEWQGVVLSRIQPNLQTYKQVLRAWAHATHTVEGPDRAEEILRHLLSFSKAGNLGAEVLPDAECFHIVMKAHAESVRRRRKGDDGSSSAERARRVTALLDWMELLALRITTSNVRPTTESYRIALSAWAWSHHVDAPKEAGGILYRMVRACDSNGAGNDAGTDVRTEAESPPVRPETRDFNTVINCCSFARKVGADKSEEDDESLLQRQIAHREVFDIAEGALNALLSSEHARPDSATFSGIIRACVNLLPDTDLRDERVIELFETAYRTAPSDAPSPRISSKSTERMRAPPGAGCVDANVLRQLRHALPSTKVYIRVREDFEKFRRQNAGEA